MSTSYYRLRHPWSSIRVERTGHHSHITLWQGGGNAGILTVEAEVEREVLLQLADQVEDHEAPMRTHSGGAERGTVVTVHEELPDETTLIDEYGRVLTVAQVLARDGAKRADGWPTELFGYEENNAEDWVAPNTSRGVV